MSRMNFRGMKETRWWMRVGDKKVSGKEAGGNLGLHEGSVLGYHDMTTL